MGDTQENSLYRLTKEDTFQGPIRADVCVQVRVIMTTNYGIISFLLTTMNRGVSTSTQTDDQPVMRDSSAMECPSMTLPSTGNFPPGTTLTTSPLCTSSTSICSSLDRNGTSHKRHAHARCLSKGARHSLMW